MAGKDDLVLKISADTTAVASGLKPMSTALDTLEQNAEDAHDALQDLDRTQVDLDVRDQAIKKAKDDIKALRDLIAEQVAMDVDTRAAQRKLTGLQTAVKKLTDEKHEVDIEIDTAKPTSGMEGLREGVRETSSSLGTLSTGFTGMSLVAGAAMEAVSDLNEMLQENIRRNDEAGRSTGRMQRAVGSATNFLSGPWGLAIAAGTILLGQWSQSQDEAAAATQALSESIDFQAGAYDRNNRMAAAKMLEEKGLLELAQKNNLSTRDMTDALLGNADAQERVNGALNVLALRQKFVAPFIRDMQKDFNELVRVNEATATSQGRVTGAVGDTTEAVDDNRSAVEDAKKAYDDLIDSVGILNKQFATARQLASDYEKTQDDLNDAIKNNKHTMDLSTEAGRKNDALIREQAENIAALTEARLKDADKTGESTEDILADYRDQRNSLKKTADELGLSEDAADKYIDKLLKTPKNLKTEIEVELTPNMDKFNRLPQRIQDAISGNGNINMGATANSAPMTVSPNISVMPRLYLDSRPIAAIMRSDITASVQSTVASATSRRRL